MSSGRSVWRTIASNFLKSLRVPFQKEIHVGEDHYGNNYFESPPRKGGIRKTATRWFVPKEEGDWQQNLPAEWEAWLRGRRQNPPTYEEVQRNLEIANLKKMRAAELEMNRQDNIQVEKKKTIKGYPDLEELEKDAGESFDPEKYKFK
ncbi:Mimitin, mitochondrial, partial [Stegodyphus mimosarum]